MIPRRPSRRKNSHLTPAGRHVPSPNLLESIQRANNRAHQRANRRVGRRKGVKSIHAALASEHDEDYFLSTTQLAIRTLLALILILPSAISTMALFTISDSMSSSIAVSFWSQLFKSPPFIFFFAGSLLMAGWFYTRLFSNFFLYLYVLGHELTHVVFIFLCGGRVSGFKVSLDGGYVMTNKSNIIIALSPYFVPFWSAFLLLTSLILRLFIDIPYHNEILYGLIGFTWTFHLTWTCWMIPRDQPDLKENGTFFSLVVIYLANVLLLAGMLCVVPGGLRFTTYFYHWYVLFSDFITICVKVSDRMIY